MTIKIENGKLSQVSKDESPDIHFIEDLKSESIKKEKTSKYPTRLIIILLFVGFGIFLMYFTGWILIPLGTGWIGWFLGKD